MTVETAANIFAHARKSETRLCRGVSYPVTALVVHGWVKSGIGLQC